MPGGLILEKRSYDSRVYDLICTRLLPLGVTIALVNQVLSEPVSAGLIIGSAVVNTQPNSYYDNNGNLLLTAPPGTVIQVKISGGVLPLGSGGQTIAALMCTIRAQFTDTEGNNVEATALLNLTNYVQAV
jgi:hypothetical protein